MIELLELELFRNATLIGLMTSALFGLISFFIVTGRLTFLGAGIAHTAFGGIAIGIVAGIDPYLSALIFCVAAALLIGRISRSGRIGYDTTIGIFFTLSMALGGILLTLQGGYTFDLASYLFGSILGVSRFDLFFSSILFAAAGVTLIIFFNRILFAAFDRESALAGGLKADLYNSILLAVLAASIVAALKIAGIILVTALVALPASFALLFSKKLKNVITISIIYSIFTVQGGLVLSFYVDTPPGATMALLGGAVYLSAAFFREIFHKGGTA